MQTIGQQNHGQQVVHTTAARFNTTYARAGQLCQQMPAGLYYSLCADCENNPARVALCVALVMHHAGRGTLPVGTNALQGATHHAAMWLAGQLLKD